MDVHNDLQEHKEKDNEFHDTVHSMFSVIKDNHLAHIQISMTALETKFDLFEKLFWIIVPAIIGSLIIGIMNLILK